MAYSDYQNVYKCYTDAKETREQYKPTWDKVSQFVAIGVQPNYLWNNTGNKSARLDQYVDDPTSAIAVNQAGDYMLGIMWGTGDKAVRVEPSRYIEEIVDPQTVKDYYDFVSDTLLYQMNHSEAGLNNSFRPYVYDQFSFGTSGVGTFPNTDFLNGVSENALIFRSFGVDNLAIDEGKAGNVDIVFAVYQWALSRILGEFCTKDGEFDKTLVSKLPKEIQAAYKANDYTEQFTIVFGAFPRSDFSPKLKGKRGTKYRGVWFMDAQKEDKFFYEEDFRERPIAICRQIKVRGEVWGRASGTLLLSSISSVNFMLGEGIEVIEKMNKPPLGVTSNALFGDSVIDTSSDGLTILNSALGKGRDALFPIFDVGNPAELLKFLIPYLDSKITTAFKVDALLDFNSAKDMTATESLQRYAIRGKSLAGMLLQQKAELLVPTCVRSLSILWDVGQLGVNAKLNPRDAQRLKKLGKNGRVIPQAVLDCVAKGLPWYKLKFSNELEKLVRTEVIQNLIQVIQVTTAIAAVYPDIIHAVQWYKLLAEINENLDIDSQILLTEDDFKAQIAAAAQARQVQMAAQAGVAGTQMMKNTADANNANAQAKATGTKLQ